MTVRKKSNLKFNISTKHLRKDAERNDLDIDKTFVKIKRKESDNFKACAFALFNSNKMHVHTHKSNIPENFNLEI